MSIKIGDVVQLEGGKGSRFNALVLLVRDREPGAPPLLNVVMPSPHEGDMGEAGRLITIERDVLPIGDERKAGDSPFRYVPPTVEG